MSQQKQGTANVKHRAVCNDCNYRGDWRKHNSDADNDATAHMKEKPTHIATVVTRQHS